ncbi:MAG TPA: hypothetical protein VH796_11265 [Nitrososphaeraceae archaeon]|jgi:hypothetical protein
MFTKKIILATLVVITIVLAGFAAALLASLSANVKAIGNDTFTRHPPTSNGSSSNNTFMAKTFQHAMNEVKKGK